MDIKNLSGESSDGLTPKTEGEGSAPAQKEVRILVVDDSEFSRRKIIKVLEGEEKFKIVGEAGNAQEAMTLLQTTNPHVAIIDVVMPDVNGVELARHIHDNFNNIYLIMISSLGQEHIVLDAISAGASDFLRKPFSAQQIVDSVYKVASSVKEE